MPKNVSILVKLFSSVKGTTESKCLNHLKNKNDELRNLIEHEKKNLADKIDNQMERTLENAVRDRIETEQKLRQAEAELKNKQKEILVLQIQTKSTPRL